MIRTLARATMMICLLCASVTSARPAMGATKINLNGDWQFRVDPKEQGQPEGWWKTLPDSTETVGVPNTWNVGKYEDYEGIAWYFEQGARGTRRQTHRDTL